MDEALIGYINKSHGIFSDVFGCFHVSSCTCQSRKSISWNLGVKRYPCQEWMNKLYMHVVWWYIKDKRRLSNQNFLLTLWKLCTAFYMPKASWIKRNANAIYICSNKLAHSTPKALSFGYQSSKVLLWKNHMWGHEKRESNTYCKMN